MVGKLILSAAICFAAVTSRGQGAAWKPLKLAKVSLTYPSTWHVTKETSGPQVHITITPDSMQQLTMQMFELMELPTDEVHNFAFFKKSFPSMLKGVAGEGGKVVKNIESTFKGHRCVYAEIISNGLPEKIYGVDDGAYVYVFVTIPRRYVSKPDAGIERDGSRILNSIAFTP